MLKILYRYSIIFIGLVFVSFSAAAQNVPSAADASRVEPYQKSNFQRLNTGEPLFKSKPLEGSSTVPKGAEETSILLMNLEIKGASTFLSNNIKNIYKDDLERVVNLSRVWEIADEITQYYRDQGYFLSRAFVPAQEIDECRSSIAIQVIEGYIGEVELIGELKEKRIIADMIGALMAHKPVKAAKVESFLLRLNDLPSVSVRAILEPLKGGPDNDGAVKLALLDQETSGTANISYNNFGSEFLGPHQVSASYDASIIPLQQTRVSITKSVPFKELTQANITHQIPLFRGVNLNLEGSYVDAEPGHTLKANNIESDSTSLGIGVAWNIVRQRLRNMSLGLKLTSKNSKSDVLGSPLSHDKIRALRASFDYDFSDQFKGYNMTSLTLSQGLNFWGASETGDLNLSRAQAKPNFTKLNAAFTRFQPVGGNWLAVGSLAGQWASDPLYSSEEFGFGGQRFGRAYDPSEITGDHGIAAMLEMRYQGFNPWNQTQITPYVFYDIGKVWNKDAGQIAHASGSSAGLGVHLTHDNGLSAGLSLAQPLMKNIGNLSSGSDDGLRVLFNLSYDFQP